MPKMPRSELKSMLAAQKFSALAAVQSSQLSAERDDALMYYMGDMSKDMPAPDGRSSAVSSDVADTIEGLMPALMDIFAGADEVVTFNPVSQEDVEAAEQETDYINHVFMNQNPGFLVLYSFIKDALLSKVGVVKVWWEEREEEENETYYDLTDEQFAILSSDEDIEITKHTQKPIDDPLLLQSLQVQQAMGQGMPPLGQAAQNGAPPTAPPTPSLHDVVATNGDFALLAGGQRFALIVASRQRHAIELAGRIAALTDGHSRVIRGGEVQAIRSLARADAIASIAVVERPKHVARCRERFQQLILEGRGNAGDGGGGFRITSGPDVEQNAAAQHLQRVLDAHIIGCRAGYHRQTRVDVGERNLERRLIGDRSAILLTPVND